MENRDQQNRFLQPIQDSDRQGERNPRVFLKAKVIPAFSQLNPDRDKIFKFSGQPLPNPKFGRDNLQKIFRFGALQELTPTLNISQDCVGKNPALSHFPTSISFGVPICHSSPAVHPVSSCSIPLPIWRGQIHTWTSSRHIYLFKSTGKYGPCSSCGTLATDPWRRRNKAERIYNCRGHLQQPLLER